MAKSLVFSVNEQFYDLEPLKLDRKKLYGCNEKIVLDNDDKECNSVSLYPELSMILPKGSTSLGTLDKNGNWVEKSDIKYINEDGSDAQLKPTSFDAPVELNETVSIDSFLEHNITAIYSLQGEENHPDFVKTIQDNPEIFTFEFSYRTDYSSDSAFLIENDGEVFILVGRKVEFEFLGLSDEGELDNDEEDSETDEEDEFDFSMM